MRRLLFISLMLATAALSPAHSQSVSPDGSILIKNLTTSAGTWTLGPPFDTLGNWYINLNGQPAAGGAGSKLVVANGGKLYALGTDSNWYLWVGGGWALTTQPTLPTIPVMPMTVPSPDGSVLLGSLQTSAGTWTFGAAFPGAPGNWYINLNGQLAAGGAGSEMVVANGGVLYASGTDSNWYVWTNGSWSASFDPLEPPSTATVVLKVGPGGQYQTIRDAVAFADADTNLGNYYDIQVMPRTYTNDFPNVTRPMTIEVDPNFAGRPVVLEGTVPLPNGKGIILTTANLTVNGLTFTGAQIAAALGANGAGIRDHNIGPDAKLTIENSIFTGDQVGVLTDPRSTNEIITVTNSKFINNGTPLTHQHGLYVNAGAQLTVTNSLFCGQLIGHDIKSRAQATTVSGNQLYDGAANPALGCNAGSTSLAVDVANGGKAEILGNTIIQGPATQNYTMIGYGAEGLIYPDNSLVVTDNNFSSPGTPHSTAIYDRYCVIAQLSNNTFSSIKTIVSPPGCAVGQ